MSKDLGMRTRYAWGQRRCPGQEEVQHEEETSSGDGSAWSRRVPGSVQTQASLGHPHLDVSQAPDLIVPLNLLLHGFLVLVGDTLVHFEAYARILLISSISFLTADQSLINLLILPLKAVLNASLLPLPWFRTHYLLLRPWQ